MAERIEKPLFFYLLLLTLFLAIAYMTVTNMAGIYIVSELGGSPEISVYPMVFFGLGNLLSIPISDPLAKRLGTLKLLSLALLGYTFFSHLCAISTTFVSFNLSRTAVGFTCGFFFILCRNLMIQWAPEDKLKSYLFTSQILSAVVPVIGLSFGAWLAYETHWRWLFYVNEPISFALAIYFWLKSKSLDSKPSPSIFDKAGYFFFVLSMGSLVTALTLSQQIDWYRSWIFLWLIALGLPSFCVFLIRCIFHPAPLVELRLLKSSLLSFSLFSLAVLYSSYYGMIILISLWLKIYASYTANWIAVLIGIMAVAAFIAFLVSKSFLRHFDPRVALALSILCLASSCYYSTSFNVEVDFFHLAVARSLSGMGLILFIFPLNNLSFASYGMEKGLSIFVIFQIVRLLFSSLGAGMYVILWQRRQAFFHERLGEKITRTSQLTSEYFDRATRIFHLTKDQATEQLAVYQREHATSLALNDVFGFMGYLLAALFILLLFSLKYKKVAEKRLEEAETE